MNSLLTQSNKGFGCGHDLAIKQGSADFILVTNIDIEFEADSLVNIMCLALHDDDKVASWEFRQKPYEHPKYYDPITFHVTWSSHACVLMRRLAYERVGGYEPKIFMYGEDVELSYRFRSADFLLKYVPSAVVYHYTYEEAQQFKPLQFSGSILSNAYIRFRYGSARDIFGAIALQLGLLIKGAGFAGSRELIVGNLRKSSDKCFPFRGFDYEMIREGAFYDCKKPVTTAEESPLVSIITRTYKGRDTMLKDCIVSVLNQTYPNIEHIIVEDGGDTMTPLIKHLKGSYSKKYNLIYKALPKKGRSYAGNKALALAKGRMFMFLDDDDFLMADHVEVLVAELISNTKIKAAYSLAWDIHTKLNNDNQGNLDTYQEMLHTTLPYFYQEFSRERLLKENYIPIQSILFMRELFDNYGGFDESMDQLEDWNLWIKYALNSDFKFVKKTTSIFRTPYDLNERVRRQKLLDVSYAMAVKKNARLLGRFHDKQ
ncbi:MAG: glycosyltransferase [Methylococcales bacterium]|nr:glycosyltransferase [Methylococcales bacterium]